MKCVISGKETQRKFKSMVIDRDVYNFAKSYRDHLLIKDKRMNVQVVLAMFHRMTYHEKYSWDQVKDILMNEMLAINKMPA